MFGGDDFFGSQRSPAHPTSILRDGPYDEFMMDPFAMLGGLEMLERALNVNSSASKPLHIGGIFPCRKLTETNGTVPVARLRSRTRVLHQISAITDLMKSLKYAVRMY
ncbi:hypothetical protein KIN20_025956 [Parelaphostrongylus tenuis]|uniref:Uncharacterized protein n=1 Tax=Parelaphostrongylus tenuis TaxID=148309 RepID=A0AAD5NDJ6_PARTN|nr:hypothetical protein KIN20_025956 [Parelaphostrongylus tenuis]